MRRLYWLVLLFAPTVWGGDLRSHPTGIWSIAGTAQQNRWVIIHNLSQAKQTGIYHIEVIGRGKKDPVWQIQHIANHIALTEAALSQSVIAPLKKGAVYPESFDSAYQKWQTENNGAGGAVCQTEVLRCLPLHNNHVVPN
jgi:hypothetical protein